MNILNNGNTIKPLVDFITDLIRIILKYSHFPVKRNSTVQIQFISVMVW